MSKNSNIHRCVASSFADRIRELQLELKTWNVAPIPSDSRNGNKIKTDQNNTNYNLSQKEKFDIYKMLLENYTADSGMGKSEIMEAISASKIELSNNKSLGLVIGFEAPGFCGASGGNCDMWVVEKDGNNYRQLLETNGLTIDLEKKITNGYRDISCSSHLGRDANEDRILSIYIYKYNGNEYVEHECWLKEGKKKRTKCPWK